MWKHVFQICIFSMWQKCVLKNYNKCEENVKECEKMCKKKENTFCNSFSDLFKVDFTFRSCLLKFSNSELQFFSKSTNLLIYYIISQAWIQVGVRVQNLNCIGKNEKSGS